MIESQEIELKLEIASGQIGAFRHSPALGNPARRPVRQHTIYYDTPEGDLRKAGYSLRVRKKRAAYVQTLKQRSADSGGFSSRAEWEQKIAGPGLDLDALRSTPVGELLSRRDMKKRLEIASETRVRRTTWRLRRGRSQIELILDEGEVVSGKREQPICEIELELKRGKRGDLFNLARDLAHHIPLRMGVTSKSERGYLLGGGKGARVSKADRVLLDPEMTIADAFAIIVQSCLRHFRLNEALLIERRNAAALHQARVAMRRLRSALSLFRPAVGGEELDRLRTETRWFADTLGDARNLDVILATQGRDAPALDHESLRRLRKDRKHAYVRVRQALADPRLPALILDIVAWAEAGEWRQSRLARQGIIAFASERLGARWRRVRKDGVDIGALGAEARHRLRINIKKLRYAAEFFANLAGRDTARQQKDFLVLLEGLQETLGRLNDIETMATLAPALAASGETISALAIETKALIDQAQKAHDRLRALGPYW